MTAAAARPLTPIFDIGRVLLRWEPERALAPYFRDTAEIAAFMAEVGFFAWHARQDAGRPVADGVAELAARFPVHERAIAGFYERWLDAVPGEVPGSRAILEGLAAQGPIYGLSNFSRELFDRTEPHHPILQRFAGLVLSGDVGLNKPDPGLYAALIERYGLSPEACIFIDDSAANVETARRLGMVGVQFMDAPQLSVALSELGFRW